MTDTATEETPQAEATPPEEAAPEEMQPEEVNCRWCGKPHELAADDSDDWLCEDCERYQDAMTCPTCHQLTRVSLLSQDLIPEAHAPSRRRRAKES